MAVKKFRDCILLIDGRSVRVSLEHIRRAQKSPRGRFPYGRDGRSITGSRLFREFREQMGQVAGGLLERGEIEYR